MLQVIRGVKRYCPARVGKSVDGKFRKIQVLNKGWQMKIDPKSVGDREHWYQDNHKFELPVQVPGCIQSMPELAREYPASQCRQNSYLGTVWLRSQPVIPGNWKEGKSWLKFGGIMPAAHIWLNGDYVGCHSHSPISVKWDVSDVITPGDNCLTVKIVEQDIGLAGGMRMYTPWSGLYRRVELEYTPHFWIEDIYIRPDIDNLKVLVQLTIHNGSSRSSYITIRANIHKYKNKSSVSEQTRPGIKIEPGNEITFNLEMPVPDCELWSPDFPALYLLEISLVEGNKTIDLLSERFGMRELRVKGNRLELNREPFMLRAWGEEYFSPYISPILDKSLLQRKILLAKKMGFNAVRRHTHVPPPEELDLCDELGLLVHNEISVISNFNKTEPYPENKKVWREHILESRNHPSVVIYCMGNEGSQIVGDKELQRRAYEYYRIAKELAPDHLVIYASGSQGEYPFMPNDFETPHLWSRNFKWAYEGLTRVPWNGLKDLFQNKVCVLHEYGKMTVWPEPKEEKLYENVPFVPDFGQEGAKALQQAKIGKLLSQIVRNSRCLAVLGQEICTKKEVSNVIPETSSGQALKCSSSGRGNQGSNSFGHPPNQEEGPKDGDKGRGRSRS